MADNVNVTPGTGKTIAADDVSSVFFQKIKLDAGGDGVSVPVIAGRQADAASVPVALSSEDVALLDGIETALASLDANLASIDGHVDGLETLTGAVNETAPATDTANSGVNGRLQRIAQRLTSLITAIGTQVFGAGIAAAAQRTTLASDDPAVSVLGATTGAAIITDADGTIQRYLRGIIKLLITAGSALVTATGSIAHDGADSGNPVKVGGRAVNAEIAAVANNDRSDLLTDLVGKLIVLPYANPENFVSGAITSAMTGTTSTSLIAAPAAGLRNYITTIIVSNAHASVGTDVIIQDGSGGTTLLTIPAASIYGGAVITLPTPLRQPTTATAIYCANVTTGASTKVSAVGYKGA